MMDDKSRLRKELTNKVVQDARSRLLADSKKAGSAGLPTDNKDVDAKRRRCELLDMTNESDQQRWQILHNDTDRYEVISEKISTVRGDNKVDYMCFVVYNELGDDLPIYRTKDELRQIDSARLSLTVGGTSGSDMEFTDLVGD